jgi:hypothetical protein
MGCEGWDPGPGRPGPPIALAGLPSAGSIGPDPRAAASVGQGLVQVFETEDEAGQVLEALARVKRRHDLPQAAFGAQADLGRVGDKGGVLHSNHVRSARSPDRLTAGAPSAPNPHLQRGLFRVAGTTATFHLCDGRSLACIVAGSP